MHICPTSVLTAFINYVYTVKQDPWPMKSKFTFEEVSEMLDMTTKQIESEIDSGNLSFTYDEGEKKITLYDLEKYMGSEQTMKIVREYSKKS